jgi:C-terminal processing protease CtpA/Prc
MEQQKGKLVSLSGDHDMTMDSVLPYPQKVIILINKSCGSTTEEFLLMAKQSRKVVLLGESTARVLDYANVRGTDFSTMPYMLYWATSRSRRIDQGLAIDNVGIMPDKLLKDEQNWVEEAKRYAEQTSN